jgi:hypothetical protein
MKIIGHAYTVLIRSTTKLGDYTWDTIWCIKISIVS